MKIHAFKWLHIAVLISLLSAAGVVASPISTARADAPAKCAELTVEQPTSEACLAEITANPAPNLERPVKLDPKKDGASTPRSILLPEVAPAYPIGWMLKNWYYSDAPGTYPENYTNDRMIKKATLVYIYATVKVKGFDWLLIGPNQWIGGEHVAVLRFAKRPATVSGQWIALDLDEQTLIAFVDDKPVFATLISAAWGGYGVTREGLFHIYARTRSTTFRGPPWAKVPEYIYAHVPDVMFFDQHIGLHGAYWHDWFGFQRTHGCVNIPVGDEAWLWNWVDQTADQWGPDDNGFHLRHPEQAPFVYVYRSTVADSATPNYGQ